MPPRNDGADAAADLDRRIRLIAHRNPGHSAAAVRQAAEAEAAAIVALASADAASRDAAKLQLRLMQLRTANMDMTEAEARDLARIQLAGEPTHFTGHSFGRLFSGDDT